MDETYLPKMSMKIAKNLSSGPEIILMTFLYTKRLILHLDPTEIPVLLSVLCMNTNRLPEFEEYEKLEQ